MSLLPKIFFTVAPVEGTSRVVVSALAEDGTGLARASADHEIYARYEIGVVGRNFHEIYHNHYPDGWMIVDHTQSSDEELEADVAYMRAMYINSFEEEKTNALDQETGEQREGPEDGSESSEN